MKNFVTGAAGFVRKDLVENLKNIHDRKNRTRPNQPIDAIYKYERNNTLEELDQFCADCDFVFSYCDAKDTIDKDMVPT